MTHTCTNCGTAADMPDQLICTHCGADLATNSSRETEVPTDQTCPSCGRAGAPTARFCRFDGTPLDDAGTWPEDENGSASGGIRDKAIVFWNRFGLLINTTAVLILPALLLAPEAPPISVILLVPAVTAWIVALYDWPVLERMVSGADDRFERAYNRDLSEAGKLRRYVIRPIVALQARWIGFAQRAPSNAVFAAMRWFGYVVSALLAVTIIGLIIYAVIVAILAALILIAAVIAAGLLLTVMGGGSGAVTHSIGRRALGGMDPLMAAGRRGRELYSDRGGLFDISERVGRIDKDGRVYSGKGGLFDIDEQIGQIDKDGRVYETDGGIFSVKRQVGRVGDDGQIYETEGGLFDIDERVGKVDREGNIYRGRGGLFDLDEQVGKSK